MSLTDDWKAERLKKGKKKTKNQYIIGSKIIRGFI